MSYGRNRYKPDRTVKHALRHHRLAPFRRYRARLSGQCIPFTPGCFDAATAIGSMGRIDGAPSATPYTIWDASAKATVTPRSTGSGDRLSSSRQGGEPRQA